MLKYSLSHGPFSLHTDTQLTTVLSTTQRHPDGQSEPLQRSLLPLSTRSLRSPSRHQPRLWAQLTRQHREGPLPFSGPFGQRVHGWRQLELPPLYHQLLAASAAQQLRAVHEAAMQQVGST